MPRFRIVLIVLCLLALLGGRAPAYAQEADSSTVETLRSLFEALKGEVETDAPDRAAPDESEPPSLVDPIAWRTFDLDGALRCGVDTDGVGWCWSRRAGVMGTGGDPLTQLSSTPVRTAGSHTFTTIAVESSYACGIDSNGQAWCWGRNGFGNLGNGARTSRRPEPRPVRVRTDQRFQTIVTSDYGTCALNEADRLYCWGGMGGHLLGIGSVSSSDVPVPYVSQYRWKQISLGSTRLCGVTQNGTGYCWGTSNSYALGNGDWGTKLEPTEVGGGHRWQEIHQGSGRSCGLTTDGRAWCWGSDGNSWLGHDGAQPGTPAHCERNPFTCAALPMPVDTDVRFTELAVSNSTACGLDAEGRAWCWGSGRGGTLGDGIVHNDHHRKAVRPVQTDIRFRSITVRGRQACGIARGDRQVWCWGHLNEETGTPEPVPAPKAEDATGT